MLCQGMFLNSAWIEMEWLIGRWRRWKLGVFLGVSAHSHKCVYVRILEPGSLCLKITCHFSLQQKRTENVIIWPLKTINHNVYIQAFTIWLWGAVMHQIISLTALQCVHAMREPSLLVGVIMHNKDTYKWDLTSSIRCILDECVCRPWPRGVLAENNVVSLFPIKQNSKLFTGGHWVRIHLICIPVATVIDETSWWWMKA